MSKRKTSRFALPGGVLAFALACLLPWATHKAFAQSLMADDFESGLRVINPTWSVPENYIWHNCDVCDGDTGSEAVNSNDVYEGNKSLEITITKGTAYMHWWTLRAGSPNTWRWLREWVLKPGDWQFGTYDMLRFWMKVPPGIQSRHGSLPAADYNLAIGTYLRASSTAQTLQESPDTTISGIGHHWYHWYNIPYTGEWHQVLVDTSPDLQRDVDPSLERGNQEWVIRDQYGDAWNYFDAMTRIYFDFAVNPSSYPARFYFDKFEFFRNPNKDQEDVVNVRSLNGVYVPSTKRTYVSWRSVKTNSVLTHEVRYAFSDIHALGFNNATPAPGGTIRSSGVAGYNSMEYNTTSIDPGSNPYLFIAIRRQGTTKFRQIVLPTRRELVAPSAPQNLRIR